MNEYAIEMKGVAKRYGKHCVLDGFDLAVPKGAVYALLGNNGAGKSTSIKLMCGQLIADSGKISVLGLDPVKEAIALRLRLGYVAETERLFDFLTPPELFAFLKHFFPDWSDRRAAKLMHRFRLPSDKKIGSFSRGMYAKTALITVMARRPELVILDDPALGLDTVSRSDFMTQLIESIQEYEHTILLSSHLIPEVEQVAAKQAKANGTKFEIVHSMEEAFKDADIVYPKSWAPYAVMGRRTELLKAKDMDGLKALEKECLANNAKFKNWECTEEKMKLTKGGKALYMHCLPADITGVSCKEGEVAASVFDRYRLDTYHEAGWKPYIIASMILNRRFKDIAGVLEAMKERATPRINF